MKKRKTLIIILFIVVIFSVLAYAVMPSKDIKYYTHTQKKNVIESLMNVSGAKLNNKSLEITLNEDNVNELISSIDDLNEYKVELNSNDGEIHIPVTFMKVVKTDINVLFDVKAENNKLKVTVKESKIGKIKIDNKRVMEYVKDGTYNGINVEKNGNDIYVSSKSLSFDEAYIKNNELFVKCSLDIKGILDSLKNKVL